MFILDWIRYWKQKKEAAHVVISAETVAYETGLNAIDIISQYNKPNVFISEIKKLYAQNKPKHIIYRKIFDNEFLFLLKACEEKGLLVGEIFKDYMNVREKIQSARNKIITSIVYPFLSYFLGALIVFIILIQMNKQLKQFHFLKTNFIDNILFFYWFFIIGIALAIMFPLLKFPRYIPILRKAYKELDAFQYISSIYFVLRSGLSMVDVYEMLKDKIKTKKRNIEGVIEFLSKYLTETELYALQIAVQTFRFDAIFKSLLATRQEEFTTRIDRMSSTLSSVLLFIVVIPASVMLYVMFRLYTIISTITKSGAGI